MHNSVNFADPVRPRGHLVSTVAELALHVINYLRRGAVKHVLPLRFATYLIDGNLDCAEVARAFSKSKNNLHHRQMVRTPFRYFFTHHNLTICTGCFFVDETF